LSVKVKSAYRRINYRPLTFNLSTGWRWAISFTFRAFQPL